MIWIHVFKTEPNFDHRFQRSGCISQRCICSSSVIWLHVWYVVISSPSPIYIPQSTGGKSGSCATDSFVRELVTALWMYFAGLSILGKLFGITMIQDLLRPLGHPLRSLIQSLYSL